MRKLTLFILFFLVGAIVFFSCRKPFSIDDVTYNSGILVTASISGRVTDIAGKPISNATINAGFSATTTDVNGQFLINNAQLTQNAGIIKVSKTGFFNGARTIVVKPDLINNVSIQLIPKSITGTFVAISGGTITLTNGSSVRISANAVVTGSGIAYSGNVSVSSYFLNPSDPNLNQYMPGELRGINSSNQENSLLTYGMMAVELNGESGEKLQLATGKPATLTFPITTALQTSSPSSIALWYFNDSTGMWKEEGSAAKSGNSYIGNVTHFTYWNCDFGKPLIQYEAKFKDQNGTPLSNARVSFTRSLNDSIILDTRSAYTSSDGSIVAKLPSNEVLKMKVYFSNCSGSPVYTKTVGPASQDVNDGSVSVTLPTSASVTFTGTAVDCNGAAIASGYAGISIDGSWYNSSISNGVINFVVPRCNITSAIATINVFDLSGAQQNLNPVSVAVTSGTYNLGQLSACGLTTAEYINLDMNGISYSFLPPADSLLLYNNGSSFGLSGNGKSTNNYFYLSFSASGTGMLNSCFLYATISVPAMQPNGNIPVNITEFGAVGQYIGGTFSGILKDSLTNNSVTLSNGKFRVKRQN